MFTPNNCVLLLVDVQGQLAQAMYEKDRLFTSLEILLKGVKVLGVPIIWMEQIPSKLGPTIEPLSTIMDEEQPIEKSSFSCCKEPKFNERFLSLNRNQVLIAGIETHICIFQTAYDLLNQGFEVQVVSDCVSSRILENKNVGLQRIFQSGGQITSVEMLFFELMGEAGGEQFRQIVKLIK